MTARLGIVTGMRAEAALLRRCARGRSGEAPRVRAAGPSAARAAEAAAALAAEGARALLSFGVAGGLDPALVPGTVVLATEAVAATGRRIAADAAWRAALAGRIADAACVVAAPVATSEAPVVTPEAKAALRRATAAAAVDLETAAVAEAAERAGLPFLALRVVIDAADDAVPDAALAAMDEMGLLRPLRLAAALSRRPSQAARLWPLLGASRAARRRLRRVALAALPDFALPV